MGLNKGLNKPHKNFILIQNKQINQADFEKNLGFNITTYKVLVAEYSIDLKAYIQKQLEIHYKLDLSQ